MKKIMSACGGSAVGGKKIVLPLMILALSLVALPSYATTWYVDATDGIDSPDCNTSSAPCQQATYVINNILVGGDTVYLKGTFTEQLVFFSTKSGSDSAYTTLTTWPGEATAKIDATGYGNGIYLDSSTSYIKLTNLEIYGSTRGVTTSPSGANYIVLDRLTIHDCPNAVIALNNSSDNITISNNFIYNNITNTESAIEMFGASNVYILNNSFYNNRRTSGEGGACIRADANTQNLHIVNNIFNGSSKALSLIDTIYTISGNVYADNNDFYNITDTAVMVNSNNYSLSQWQSTFSQDANSLEVDPLFVSAEDFHLQIDSTLIDAGLDVSDYITTDYDGEPRSYGLYTDIGADELPIPAAPSADAIENQLSTSVTIAWTAPTTATTSYTLEYSSNQDYSDPTTVADITETHYDLTDLSVNTTYYYRIKAVYTTDYASYESDWLSSAPFITASDAPTALAAANRTSTSLDISWTAPAGTILSYSLVYAKDENFTDSSNLLNDISGTSVNIEDLDTNQAYYFTVKAYNGGIDSAYSEILATRTLPAKVTGVKVPVKFRQAHHVKIKWHKAGDDLKYRIKLMNKKGKKIKIYKTTKLKKVIKNLKADKIYKIRVRAKYDANNIGAWSKIVKFRTLAE